MYEPTLEELITLAEEIEVTDPITYDHPTLDKSVVYHMMATNVVEQIQGIPDERKLLVAMSTTTKLLVENFFLNLLIESSKK